MVRSYVRSLIGPGESVRDIIRKEANHSRLEIRRLTDHYLLKIDSFFKLAADISFKDVCLAKEYGSFKEDKLKMSAS